MACLIKRGNVFYAQYYVARKAKRISLETGSLSVAKEKLRQLKSSLYRGDSVPLPTKTSIPKVVAAYIECMQTVKTARSVVRDLYYLRDAFGQCCSALEIKNKKISDKGVKRPAQVKTEKIEANYFEQITTTDIAGFISAKVRRHSEQSIDLQQVRKS